jgi:DNA-binding MarR family transcriptional regulator
MSDVLEMTPRRKAFLVALAKAGTATVTGIGKRAHIRIGLAQLSPAELRTLWQAGYVEVKQTASGRSYSLTVLGRKAAGIAT